VNTAERIAGSRWARSLMGCFNGAAA